VEGAIQTPDEMYLSNPTFHSLVDSIVNILDNKALTLKSIYDAGQVAIQKHHEIEMDRIRNKQLEKGE